MSNVYITTYHVSLVYVHNIIPKFLKEKGRKVQFLHTNYSKFINANICASRYKLLTR